MKKIFILSIIALFCFAVFFRGTLPQTQNKIISEKIIEWFFDKKTKWSRPEDFPDTTIKFVGKLRNYDDISTNYVTSYCGGSPAFLGYMLYANFDPKENDNYDANKHNEFKKISGGKDIVKSILNTAAGELKFYDSQVISESFKSVYRKPTDSFNDILLQKIYDNALKKFVRETADVAVKITTNKTEFEKLAKEYLYKAKQDSSFDGIAFSDSVTTRLLGSETKDYPCMGGYNCRIVSIMLRRQIDGSLPAVLNCLKTVLKDYDPTYFSKISSKF